ncbi:DNA polymerase alpha/epsilon subunit B family protein [Babesia bovis T2Bo]|uniref:DNA polymerase alpha subunit B n=1 Tax=Babesia bovis TaxID=5865 RepID=A7AMJ9_BABBO|nr:DNA polymerase alpha/epsilon subunit B family protein [Babesia bovis T2Bo]EDO07783.1 DNA polymerase alpha/epsilon subunit B family protein [Babesia bovis T2Bo]|eukprot:XP_001611351.1 hypothetical protein [Babesia bovis T2Bo]
MDTDVYNDEVSIGNVSEILRSALDSSVKWSLLDELVERLEEIGANSRELMKVNKWLMEQLELASSRGALSPEEAKRAQVAEQLLRFVESKDAQRQVTVEEIYLRRAPVVDNGSTELKRGVETSNKSSMSVDILDPVPEYKCTTTSAAAVDACINDKISRFSNLFKNFCTSNGVPCDFKPLKNYTDHEVTVYGRIGSEGDVPIDALNVTIQGTRVFDYGVKAQVTNVHSMDNVCLFPGQMAALTGKCFEDEFGVRYVASKIHCGIPAPEPVYPNYTSQRFQGENVHISVVRGCLLTETLEPVNFAHVFSKIKRDRPHIVFIMGPFVSVRQMAADGEGLSRIGDIVYIYKRFFHEIAILAEVNQLKATRFFVVPHCYDVLSGFPLPQPPLDAAGSLFNDIDYPENVSFLSNPAYVRVNGILIAVTSCDPISGIANNMVCIPNEHRTRRVCEQLLLQRSFYPGYPASMLPAEYAVDHDMIKYLEFTEETIPDLFLFAGVSDSEPFVEFAGSRGFVGCHSASVPKDDVLRSSIDIYIAPQEADTAPIRSVEIEQRLSVLLTLWRG